MNQPDLFPAGFAIGARAGGFNPRPLKKDHVRILARCKVKGCKWCKAFDEHPNSGPYMRIVNNERCPAHPRAILDVHTIRGTHSPGVLCDPRCTGAVGPNCRCSCGGSNHGSDWLA